jgi:hypothetical protein
MPMLITMKNAAITSKIMGQRYRYKYKTQLRPLVKILPMLHCQKYSIPAS